MSHRILRTLRERKCLDVYTIAGICRLSISEVWRILRELEDRRMVVIEDDRVCIREYVVGEEELAEEVVNVMVKEGYEVISRLQEKDYYEVLVAPSRLLRAKGIHIAFYIRVLAGRIPLQRLIVNCKELCRRASSSSVQAQLRGRARIVVPLLVVKRGAKRVIEGVMVIPITLLHTIASSPSALEYEPYIRRYYISSS